MDVDFGPGPRDDIAQAIGRIAMESARLERITAVAEVVLMGGDFSLGSVIAHGQPWRATYQACMALIESLTARAHALGDQPAEELAAMGQALRRAEKLMAARSNVIHGAWLAVEGEEGAHRATVMKRWGRTDERPWTAESLGQLRRELRTVATEILGLMMSLLPDE